MSQRSILSPIPREPTRWRRFVQDIAARLPCRLIFEKDQLLFARYFVCALPKWLGGGQVYLHHYFVADTRQDMHDHPWSWAISCIVAGGYTEERLVEFDRNNIITHIYSRMILRKPGAVYLLTGRDFHRIERITNKTTWSLFLHAPHTKGWGFISEDPGGRGLVFMPGPGSNSPDRGQWWRTALKGRAYHGA